MHMQIILLLSINQSHFLWLKPDENNYKDYCATQPLPTDSLDSSSRSGTAVESEKEQSEMAVWWEQEWSHGGPFSQQNIARVGE